MKPHDVLNLVVDPSLILTAQRMTADPWQRELLLAGDRFLLLNCSRQSGKSTTVAALALHQALSRAEALVLLIAPAERQSRELLRKVVRGYRALGRPLAAVKQNESELELENGSRILALPGQEQTVRSFSGVNLLIIDEAARVPDDLYRSLRPMLAVSGGRLVALSTPFGQQGWFYHEWIGSGNWRRVEITWQQCPRIDPADMAEDLRAMGQGWVDQEYGCLFTALEGRVYPDFERAIVPEQPLPPGTPFGGIDFGWHNPFAAVWGVLDHDDVLWIGSERYVSEALPEDHAAALPRNVTWFADPEDPGQAATLRKRGLTVRKANNDILSGIAMVTARIRTGRLKVLSSCANLIAEARRYRWPTEAERAVRGEKPVSVDNHAMDALRYVVSKMPERSRRREQPPPPRDDDSDEQSGGMGIWRPV
jgi:hypothetical protein